MSRSADGSLLRRSEPWPAESYVSQRGRLAPAETIVRARLGCASRERSLVALRVPTRAAHTPRCETYASAGVSFFRNAKGDLRDSAGVSIFRSANGDLRDSAGDQRSRIARNRLARCRRQGEIHASL